jgi:O-antigen/teichoic acid export membrane protein
MRRDLVFRDVEQASLIARFLGCLLGIGLASVGFGTWSLVLQYVSMLVIQPVVLFHRSRWRPRLRRSFSSLHSIWQFAMPYAIMHSLNAARITGFQLMIAAFLDLTSAGYMNVAFRMTTTLQIGFTTSFVNLGLPLLARQQHSKILMEAAFLTLTRLVMLTTIPAFVGLALTANELVPILLGTEWSRTVPLVQLLATGAAISFLRFPASTMLRALGYVRYSFASYAFQLLFTLAGVVLLHRLNRLDTHLAALLWMLPAVVQLPLAFFCVHEVTTIKYRVLLGSLIPIISASAAMVVVVVEIAGRVECDSSVSRFIVEAACGAATVALVLLALDNRGRATLVAALKKSLARGCAGAMGWATRRGR